MTTLKPLATLLQSKDLNIAEALKKVSFFSNALKVKSTNLSHLNILIENVVDCYNVVSSDGVLYQSRRVSGAQMTMMKQKYTEMVNKYIESMQTRIDKRENILTSLQKVGPDTTEMLTESESRKLCQFYADLYSSQGFDQLHRDFLDEKRRFCDSFSDDDFTNYPVLMQISNIMKTSFVTTASAERSFSKMKLTKTVIRSRMADDSLSDQAVIGHNRHIQVDVEEALKDLLQSKTNTRINIQ